MILRLISAAMLLLWSAAAPAMVQYPGQQTTQIQIQYHEPVPPGGDEAQIRAKIYAEIQRDCDAATKAFGRPCVVNQVNFNDMNNGAGMVPGAPGTMLNASVNLSLTDPSPKQP